jgi:hypothetical protein
MDLEAQGPSSSGCATPVDALIRQISGWLGSGSAGARLSSLLAHDHRTEPHACSSAAPSWICLIRANAHAIVGALVAVSQALKRSRSAVLHSVAQRTHFTVSAETIKTNVVDLKRRTKRPCRLEKVQRKVYP